MNEVFGMDEELEGKEEKVVEMTKKKKKAFAYWEVGKKEYKLKLLTEQTCKLEEKFKTNLMSLLTGGNVPPLGIMLTVIQLSISPWKSGVKYRDVQKMFDQYVEDGGTQITLFTDVIMQILMVSGFFTGSQIEEMTQNMNEVKELL